MGILLEVMSQRDSQCRQDTVTRRWERPGNAFTPSCPTFHSVGARIPRQECLFNVQVTGHGSPPGPLTLCSKSVTQSCPTVCDPMDCSPLGSSVHGISQAGILEQVAVSASRGSSCPRDRTHVSYIGRQILYH